MPPTITMAKIVSEIEKPNSPGVASCRKPLRQRPGEAGHGRRDAEHHDLGPEDVLAERPHGQLVLADALQHPPVGRLADAPAQQPHDGHRDHEGEQPVGRLLQRPPEELDLREG